MKPCSSAFVESPGGGPERIFAANECSMIEIGEDHYAAIGSLLADAVGGGGFFSGSIGYDCGEFGSRLTATLLIYREGASEGPSRGGALCENSSCGGAITDIVPVWWEFSSVLPDGMPVLNDFSFKELKQYLI